MKYATAGKWIGKLVWLGLCNGIFVGGAYALPEKDLVNTLHPFVTDGCTDSPNGLFGATWTQCCITHDLAYWEGGTSDDKHQADETLKACITGKSGSPLIGDTYFAAVDLFGAAFPRASWVWGYGWTYFRGFETLGPDELAQVNALKPQNLQNETIVSDPQSNERPYPSETKNYCLDEVIESVSQLVGTHTIQKIVYHPPGDLTPDEAFYARENGGMTVTVNGCEGKITYSLQPYDTDRCSVPIYADHRPQFISNVQNTLKCQ
jgi:hypothetical protein